MNSSGLSLWPPVASAEAVQVDGIFVALLFIAGAIILLVGMLLLVFGIRFRRGSSARREELPSVISRDVEIGWTAGTVFLALFLFWWAGSVQLAAGQPPADALEVHVVGKQWMWKLRHPSGAREINELHVPIGEPVRLVMTSQDVIHSFYVPAFRVKQDAVPGRYTEAWFRATREGEYHIFCTEFCGTDHAVMGGKVVVMQPADYARWAAAQPEADSLPREGARLFVALGCSGCHAPSSAVHAPGLAGVYGRTVHLADGRAVRADEAYLRDSILQPKRDVVAGYEPIMPSFAGAVDEDELQKLVAYLMQLRDVSTPPGGTP
jgi:cytochrome c oxidase subunit II